MDQRLSTPLDLYENVAYRWYLIPDYGPNESRIIWFMDHCGFDGVTLVCIWNEMQDKPDLSGLNHLSKRYTLFERVLYNLTMPFIMSKFIIDQLQLQRVGNSTLRQKNTTVPQRQNRIVEGIDLVKFKKKCKELRISNNELAQAVLSMTVQKYMKETGD